MMIVIWCGDNLLMTPNYAACDGAIGRLCTFRESGWDQIATVGFVKYVAKHD